ncbi:hypothetical protein [Kitasatospora sp. CB01950]|uniref:hypothetical protein n=1 Tax=Kitasatospora sp. CB01950 TaxID=1703930 RepID=UPI0009F96944|nr:hypothetical protein [Kitasatospora sp. CB01950]
MTTDTTPADVFEAALEPVPSPDFTEERPAPAARLVVLLVVVVTLLGSAVGFALHTCQRDGPHRIVRADATFTLDEPGLYYRDAASGRIARAPHRDGGSAVAGGPSCERFYAAGDRALCLRTKPGRPPCTEAVVYDRHFHRLHTFVLPGTPSLARVSPSGQVLSWTTFATGRSYAATGFGTRTSVLDLRTGSLVRSIETIPLTIDGDRPGDSDPRNFWSVSFAADDNRFYATVSVGGRTHLVEGDLRAWSAHALRENVECPALSPDGTRIAFKKRVSPGTADPWRLYVLDLADLHEHAVAETRSVDDQAAWLDAGTLAYALPAQDGRATDLWSVPADGTGRPHLLAAGASSPANLA